jgi:ribosome-associated protein
MKYDVPVKNGIVIPEHELEITTSRAGGPGGQHVNRTDTRVTVRWNVRTTNALSPEQKVRVMHNLQSRLTSDGELIVHNSTSRSQQQNKEAAFAQLAHEVGNALYIPKVRMKTRVSKAVKEARLHEKTRRSEVKKMRSFKF